MVVKVHPWKCSHCTNAADTEHTPGRAAPSPKGWSYFRFSREPNDHTPAERVLCDECTTRLAAAVGEAGF